MTVTRQVMRAQERKKKKEDRKLIRKLQLCDFTYEADDKNMTLSALGPQLVDFTRVIGLSGFFREHVHIDKRKSPYSPGKLFSFLVLQNIMGYGRIESSRALKQDRILKEKLGIKDYPDPETFRDELLKYNAAFEQCPGGASVSNSWFSPQRSGGRIRSSLLNCRVPPGAKRRGEPGEHGRVVFSESEAGRSSVSSHEGPGGRFAF